MKIKKALAVAVGAALLGMASSSALAEMCTVGMNAEVLWKGEWYKAKVLAASPEGCKITYTGYGSEWDEWVGPDRLKIKVSWKGDWYPARVVRREGNNYLVKYDGYGDEDNEIVPASRIQMR